MKLREIDPLFQFLGAGALLLVLSLLVRPWGSDEETIRVDRASLEQYLSAGGGEALAGLAKAQSGKVDLDALDAGQRDELVRRYVEEQALYREARAWGLEDNDLVIRRRLGQSLRFALRPAPQDDPGDEVLRAFYDRNRANYRAPAESSFDHVFFSAEKRGESGALASARAGRDGSLANWRAKGDRFAYQRSYTDAGPATVEAQLGEEFAGQLAQLPVAPERWQGPLRSAMGFHLVRLTRRRAAQTAPFEEARAAVLDDWQRQQQNAQLEESVGRIVDRYETQIDADLRKDGSSQR